MADDEKTPTPEEQKEKCVNEVRAVMDRYQFVFNVYTIIQDGIPPKTVVDLVPKPAADSNSPVANNG